MPTVINTNLASLYAQNNLSNAQNSLAQSVSRLSSGLRINSAKDDAAGLSISQIMTAQIRGLNQAVRNANDGISMLQTADGAMIEQTNMLQRMRELAVQSANGTYSASQRGYLQVEFEALSSQIGKIASENPNLPFSVIRDILIADQEEPSGEYQFGRTLTELKRPTSNNLSASKKLASAASD